MDKPLGVDRRQRPQDGDHDVQRLICGDPASRVGDVAFEADPFDIVHNEIGRTVFVKVTADARDIGMADELRQCPGLLPEALRAVGEVLRPGVRHDRDRSAFHTGGDFTGHIFLNGHLGLELGVEGQIGDAETALAQDAAHNVAVIQDHPSLEGRGEFFPVVRQIESALGAGAERILQRLKTVVAGVVCPGP